MRAGWLQASSLSSAWGASRRTLSHPLTAPTTPGVRSNPCPPSTGPSIRQRDRGSPKGVNGRTRKSMWNVKGCRHCWPTRVERMKHRNTCLKCSRVAGYKTTHSGYTDDWQVLRCMTSVIQPVTRRKIRQIGSDRPQHESPRTRRKAARK